MKICLHHLRTKNENFNVRMTTANVEISEKYATSVCYSRPHNLRHSTLQNVLQCQLILADITRTLLSQIPIEMEVGNLVWTGKMMVIV